MDSQDALKKIGLSDDEIAVYLSALQLGPSLVTKIAKHAGVKRTSVYLVAKSLMAKGLLGKYKTKSGIHLSAENPEKILSQMEEKTKEISLIIPQLKAVSKKDSHSPQVKYFEGEEGYFSVCEYTLEKHASELLWLGDPSAIYEIIGNKYDEQYYIPTRIKRKIKLRALLFENSWAEKFKEGYDGEYLREVRFLPKEFNYDSTQFIYQNKVAFVSSTKELISVLIESEDIVKMERKKFEMLWQLAGR